MTDFDPETFAEEKYVEYFPELQQAYKRAFETMNEEFDSQLVHAIDQQVLNESEPFYRDGEFRVELPEDPHSRLKGVVVDGGKLDAVLDRYTEEIRHELRREFDLPGQGN